MNLVYFIFKVNQHRVYSSPFKRVYEQTEQDLCIEKRKYEKFDTLGIQSIINDINEGRISVKSIAKKFN